MKRERRSGAARRRRMVGFKVSPAEYARLVARAEEADVTVSELVRVAIVAWMERVEDAARTAAAP